MRSGLLLGGGGDRWGEVGYRGLGYPGVAYWRSRVSKYTLPLMLYTPGYPTA